MTNSLRSTIKLIKDGKIKPDFKTYGGHPIDPLTKRTNANNPNIGLDDTNDLF